MDLRETIVDIINSEHQNSVIVYNLVANVFVTIMCLNLFPC